LLENILKLFQIFWSALYESQVMPDRRINGRTGIYALIKRYIWTTQ